MKMGLNIAYCSSLTKEQSSTTFRSDCFRDDIIIPGVMTWAKAAHGKNS